MAQRKADIARKRSGKHVTPRWRLTLNQEAWMLVDKAAELAIETRAEWVRGKLAIAIADELKLDPAEMIELFDQHD